MKGAAATMLAAVALLLPLAAALPPHLHHAIVDAKADIRDLDVGDINDMESDVPPPFLEEVRKQRTKPPALDMSNPMDFMANSQSGTQMTFATLTQQKSEELLKPGTEKLASAWKSMLESGGVNAQVYATDPGKILFVTTQAGLVGRVKEFVLSQPDVDWFEFNQNQIYPDGRTEALMGIQERAKRSVELGWRPPDPPPKGPPTKSKKKGKKKKEKKSG